jgi:hypothetical protein
MAMAVVVVALAAAWTLCGARAGAAAETRRAIVAAAAKAFLGRAAGNDCPERVLDIIDTSSKRRLTSLAA